MKTGKYYFILVAITGILCVPALGQVQLPQNENRPFLIGQANPALGGIEKLYVFIVPPDSEPNKDGLVWRELEAKVISKLNEAGIKIMHVIAGNILNIDELRVYIDMLKLDDSQKYVFRTQTSLARMVNLPKSRFGIKADIWKTEPVMQVVPAKDMAAKVTAVVMEQVEVFIGAWSVANPKGVQSSDVNDANSISLIEQKKSIRPSDESATAKSKYAASKNSKVFHKSDCSSAKRILAKNLVGYSIRNEAIKADKRPCKRCKP